MTPRAIRVAVFYSIAAVALMFGYTRFLHLQETVCRGLDCIFTNIDLAEKEFLTTYFRDRCAYLGEPTGISVFKPYKYGAFVRSLLGAEYTLFSSEFLYIYPIKPASEKVILISANKHYIHVDSSINQICGRIQFTYNRTRDQITVKGEE